MKRDREDDGTGSFYQFTKLCVSLNNESSYNGKTKAVEDFLESFEGDKYLVCKLLLCKQDQRVYHLADKAIAKVFAVVVGRDEEEVLSQLTVGGDASVVCSSLWKDQGEAQKWSTWTLGEVDAFLDRLTEISKREQQVAAFSKMLNNRATQDDVKWLVRLIRHDLWIKIGPKYVLGALHPNAFNAWKKCNNLKTVVEKVIKNELESAKDGGDDGDDEDDGDASAEPSPKKGAKKLKKALSANITIGTPIKPMLAKASKSFADAVKRSPNGMCVEIKYDGERLQIHKVGDEFSVYSRNLKTVPEWKIEAVKEFVPKATAATNIILDCEVLLVSSAGLPLPFGTFNVHKKNKFADANPCLFVFDILSLEGATLLDTPFEERRQLLEKHLTPIPRHIQLSELHRPKDEADLKQLMQKVMADKLEGLIIKDAQSVYKPASRGWLKMKKDYLDDGSMADSADLVVLGAYFGTGDKGGLLSTLLLGVLDTDAKVFRTVCKCGNGMSDAELNSNQKLWKALMQPAPEYEALPAHFVMDRKHLPDYIMRNPFDAFTTPIYEIAGAEFSESNHHTADGISIRFPRFVRCRDDKDVNSATTLKELKDLFKASKEVKKDQEDGDGASPSVTPKKKKAASPMKKKKAPAKKKRKTKDDEDEEDDDDMILEVDTSGGEEQSTPPPPPASSSPAFKARDFCQWGAECKRKNAVHFQAYAHPWKKRPECPYGWSCKRKNPQHFADESHPDEATKI